MSDRRRLCAASAACDHLLAPPAITWLKSHCEISVPPRYQSISRSPTLLAMKSYCYSVVLSLLPKDLSMIHRWSGATGGLRWNLRVLLICHWIHEFVSPFVRRKEAGQFFWSKTTICNPSVSSGPLWRGFETSGRRCVFCKTSGWQGKRTRGDKTNTRESLVGVKKSTASHAADNWIKKRRSLDLTIEFSLT